MSEAGNADNVQTPVAGRMPAPVYGGLKSVVAGEGKGGGGRDAREGQRGSLRSRCSGGRATGATFMGLMYIIATQMSMGYLHFFEAGGGGWA